MSKSGGIAYLIKHGRAPSPVATRTKMTGRRYAKGGTPINNSLGYGPEFDYVFEPGGMTLDAAGKPVYHSGKFVRKAVTPAAGVGAGIAAVAPSGGSGNRSIDDESYGGGSSWRDTSLADRAAYYAANPTEAKIAGGINDLFADSVLGRGLGWLADKLDPEGARGRRQERMVYDAFSNAPGSDRYGLTDDRFNYGEGGGGGGAAVPVGGDAIDAVGSGEQAAAANLSNPAVQDAIRNSGPTITPEMIAAAIREGGGEAAPAPSPSAAPSAPAAPSDPFAGVSGYNSRGFDTPSSDTTDSWGGENFSRSDRGDSPSSDSPSSDGGGGDSGDSGGGGGDGATGGLAYRGRIKHMAAGGIGSIAQHGGFVGSYAAGGRMLRGPGDGLSDNIPAVIGRKQPARLADGEFVVSADVVSALGGGSSEAGSKKLYAMMDRIRKAAHGTKKQVKPVKERKVLPA